jgi:hypothetical protein
MSGCMIRVCNPAYSWHTACHELSELGHWIRPTERVVSGESDFTAAFYDGVHCSLFCCSVVCVAFFVLILAQKSSLSKSEELLELRHHVCS